MKVPGCPKNMKTCVKQLCPEWKCYAYEKYESELAKKKRSFDKGWE